MDRGNLFVMTGASGVGKGTIRARLLEYNRDMHYSISMTTRAPRLGEANGVDYHFVDRAAFEAKISQDGFLEYAKYVDDYYGTPREPVEQALAKGVDVLLEIEVQGALQVADRVPEAILVFVLPPNLSELRRRLLLRGTDSLEKIATRLLRAEEELGYAEHFDYVVVNDRLDQAVSDLASIIQSERLRPGRMQAAIQRAGSKEADLEAELDQLVKKLQAGD